MNDKDFWIAIRSALLAMVKAIEVKYKLGVFSKTELVITSSDDGETVSWSTTLDK